MSERNEARRDGARLQKNSGRGQQQKGDARWHDYVVDYKESAKSFSISRTVWSKVCTDTMRVDRYSHPVLKLILGEDTKIRLAVIAWERLVALETRIEELEAELASREN